MPFYVTLVKRDGTRLPLDPMQAHRAAVDLGALARRPVAVRFDRSARTGKSGTIQAIVPTDRPWLAADAKALMAAEPMSGATRWITLACKFKDIAAEPKPVSFFRDQYAGRPGLGDFWSEASHGALDVTGDAYGWFVLPETRARYVSGDTPGSANISLLFNHCIAAAEASVDFSHVSGINLMFNAELDKSAWGGSRCATLEGVVGTCVAVTWHPPWSFADMASIAHEMGHAFGLPHSDNSDGDADTQDNPWDLMSDFRRNAVHDATFGILPKHLNAEFRKRLGWWDSSHDLVLADNLPRVVVLDRASLVETANPHSLSLSVGSVVPGGGESGWYSVEVRKRHGLYDTALPGDGVIVYAVPSPYFTNWGDLVYPTIHVVDTQVPAATVSNNEGSVLKVGESWVSPDGLQRFSVVEETADGFVLAINRGPRATGGNQRPRMVTNGVVPSVSRQADQRGGRNTCLRSKIGSRTGPNCEGRAR